MMINCGWYPSRRALISQVVYHIYCSCFYLPPPSLAPFNLLCQPPTTPNMLWCSPHDQQMSVVFLKTWVLFIALRSKPCHGACFLLHIAYEICMYQLMIRHKDFFWERGGWKLSSIDITNLGLGFAWEWMQNTKRRRHMQYSSCAWDKKPDVVNEWAMDEQNKE